MRHLLPLLLLAVSPAAIAQGLKATLPGSRVNAAALVDQLGDPHYQTRDAAGQKLLALGERALPALEAGLSSPVPEVARRCADLLPVVQQKIDTDRLLAPTVVDLPEGEQTVQEVFDSLLKQTGYRLRVEGDQAVLSQKVRLTTGRVTFWEAVRTVCVAVKLDVHTRDVTTVWTDDSVRQLSSDMKAEAVPVWLRAADGRTRVSTHGALLVQVCSPSAEELAQHPNTSSPLSVRVFPEPKVKWHRLLETEVVKATDAGGKAIRSLSPAAVQLQTFEEQLLSSRIDTISIQEAATGGTLHFPAGASEIASLSALARFTVWKEVDELAAVRFTDDEFTGTTEGPLGIKLTATHVGPISNEPGSSTVEVTVRWDTDLVRVKQASAPTDGVWFENVNGRMVPVKAEAEPLRGLPTTAHGIAITNAAGEPLTLTTGSVRIDTVRENGRGYTEVRVRYVAKAGKLADGVPAAVSFHGAAVAELKVRFGATDLPLSPGTRNPDLPRYKR